MKYFGKKSLSSFLSTFLHVLWYIVLVGSILAAVAGILIYLYLSCIEQSGPQCMKFDAAGFTMDSQDKKDWETFKNLPLAVKLIIIPYCASIVTLLLNIINKSRQLFTNFKNDILFNTRNVLLISRISKLLIAFSILTFNFNSLLLSIILLMLCEILKSGTALQEEHDLTV